MADLLAVEPLEQPACAITGLDELTGLAEYRNGGLFVDGGVLVPKHPRRAAGDRTPSASPLVVEWRALTVALLDRIAAAVRALLGLDASELPLAQGARGRHLARGPRARARAPAGRRARPSACDSDGTVF